MNASDRPLFTATLKRTLATWGKPLPDADVLLVWWATLEPYPVDAVAAALAQHIAECRYAPVPADVTSRLPAPSDVRLGADEAWAVALPARDERETVVWTPEIAQAWVISKKVFDIDGDEIGARMAFRDAYTRICGAIRGGKIPSNWIVSQGFDLARREEVVTQAVQDGRLSISDARFVVPMLAAPSEDYDQQKAVTNLAHIKRMCSGIGSAKARAAEARSRHAREEADQLAAAKAETARRVAEYESLKRSAL